MHFATDYWDAQAIIIIMPANVYLAITLGRALTCNPHKNLMRLILLLCFIGEETENLSNLPKVTQLVGSRNNT